mgnify:CR=1 FL=1|tara:strand:- start:666 stop:1814 length:1149 start_codon:yes stop_codon:yes gene_type:complete
MNKLLPFPVVQFFLFAFFLIPLVSCTDPVSPEFELKEGLVFVESFASTEPSSSFVSISESAYEFGVYGIRFLSGATVSFENIGTGQTISLTENVNTYQPPEDFVVQPGESWKLNIQLANGKRIESSPETVLEPVPLKSLELRYDPELAFKDNLGGKFVPGHEISVNFDDPVDGQNYYYWSYRAFENLVFCEKCIEGVFRNGKCQSVTNNSRRKSYYDYVCDVDCWQIRFPESIAIFNDQFSNGKSMTGLPIGDVLLYNKENVLIEVQQFSLSSSAYDYYKILKDIVDDNSGLNAPPPAALIGNLTSLDDGDDFIFGRFTAAASSTATIFVDRSEIEESAIERKDPIVQEAYGDPLPDPITTEAPCSQTKYRTAIRPNGWIEL